MNDHCCPTPEAAVSDAPYRKTLWIVLLINAAMFVAEVIAGLAAGSVSLQADALDFLGDAANYGISLYVLGKSVRVRANSALIKSASMLVFGFWVLWQSLYKIIAGTLPEAEVMGVVGLIALAANLFSFYLLSCHSREDSNRQSAWLCTRNDAIGNIAVLFAAGAVYFTRSHWPDLLVALIMAYLAITSAWQIMRKALVERAAN
jgi:cation diffusion facilitator family transporter